MTVRTVLFWCHLCAGVIAGVIILTMSVTGVLLAYERQMLLWADSRGLDTSAPPGAARLPIEELVARVRAGGPQQTPAAVTVYSDPASPVAVSLGQRTLQVHPYTGAVLGEGATGLRSFFRTVTDLHRWLAMSGESRATGRAITGVSNLVFLFIVCSGVFLWWPRTLAWTRVRQVIFFRGGLRGKARDFNWHNVIGVWSAVPLFFIVLGGVVISYPWASDMVYAAFGEKAPPRQRPGAAPAERRGPGGRGPAAEDAASQWAGVDRALETAASHEPAWRSLNIRVPASGGQPLTVAVDSGSGGQPQLRATLVVNRASGEIEKEESYATQSAGRRARSWLRFAHTGEVYGLLGQTVAGLVSLGGAFLVWTGISLAIRRLLAWNTRSEKRSESRAA